MTLLQLISAFEVTRHSSWKFYLLLPCRHQRRSYLGTWKKVQPLLSSWSFWAIRLNFMILKGLDSFALWSLSPKNRKADHIKHFWLFSLEYDVRCIILLISVGLKSSVKSPDICSIDWGIKQAKINDESAWMDSCQGAQTCVPLFRFIILFCLVSLCC